MKNSKQAAKRQSYQKPTPFSQSPIWELQKQYFTESGIEAWSKSEVPHYVTSNPFMAKSYAEITLAFLRDLALDGNLDDTVYLLELGAGHGRFCYHFMKYFLPYYQQSSVKLPPFCYIISDFVEENIAFWQNHPQLSEYVSQGLLDFARFDATQDSEIYLRQSAIKLSLQSLPQPLITVANYFFDTIPQELFFIKNGSIQQTMLEIKTPIDSSIDISSAQILENIEYECSYHSVEKNHYQETSLMTLLESYQSTLHQTHLLFPDTAIRCLERLKQLSKRGLLLLTADKGTQRLEELDNLPVPSLVMHGSFSLSVNYHAIQQHCLNSGGIPLFSDHSGYSLTVGALIFMNQPEYCNDTIQAFRRFVEAFGPDDFNSLKKMAVANLTNLNASQIMSMLRMSGYDARLLQQIYPVLYKLAGQMDYRERLDLYHALSRVWDLYFDLGESVDLAWKIASLYFQIHLYEEAVIYFERSIQSRGITPQKLESLLVCYSRMKEFEKAHDVISRFEELTSVPFNEKALSSSILETEGLHSE